VSVRVVRNTGASFGIGAGHPVLVVASSAAVIAVIAVVAVLLARTRSRPAALFLAVVLGGALGNLADRVFRSPGLGRGGRLDSRRRVSRHVQPGRRRHPGRRGRRGGGAAGRRGSPAALAAPATGRARERSGW
jgi:hypothetical protein